MVEKRTVILITGAGNGIGKQLVIDYAKKGAEVLAIDKDEQGLNDTIKKAGKTAVPYIADVREERQIIEVVAFARETFGTITALINNAGLGIWKSPYELTMEEWDEVMNVNVRGYFLCAREAAKYMRNNKEGGAIVNIASTRALMSEKHSEAYAASKGAILSLTHALALSLGEDGIRVNAISPGWIETGDYEKLRLVDHNQHPARRVGKPRDISKACFFLTDPENGFITGENIVVDGGMTRKMMYEE